MHLSDLVLAMRHIYGKFSVPTELSIMMSHTNNDCASRHTSLASRLKLCFQLRMKPPQSHTVYVPPALQPVRLMPIDCACVARGQCVPEGDGLHLVKS